MSKVVTLLRRHAIAFTALFLLLGSTAYAVADQATGRAAQSRRVLYACVTDDYGTLNLTTAGRSCPDGQRKISVERQRCQRRARARRQERRLRPRGDRRSEGRHRSARPQRRAGRDRSGRSEG